MTGTYFYSPTTWKTRIQSSGTI